MVANPPDAATAREVAVDGVTLPTVERTSVDVGFGDLLLDGAVVWAVPAAAIAGPGLLLLLVVALQAGGMLAWVPAVRRLRGED